MRLLSPATENDVVCAFVRAEVDSPDAAQYIIPHVQAAGCSVAEFRAALAKSGDVRDPRAVQLARSALAFNG
jgi:hypothetical protein